MTNYAASMNQIAATRQKIKALHQEIRDTQTAIEPQPVEDYTLANADGPIRLSQLFGDKTDLFVIHNMGTTCPACTMWADGFNGVYDHLADRAAFALTTPDSPEVQKQFAASRHWRFPMVSHAGTNFAADMGYRGDNRWYPGISVFQRTPTHIVRVSDTELGPEDDFCAVWHFLAMLPEGAAGWFPKFRY